MALVLADGRFEHSYGIAAAVFAVAAASDFVDGYLARRWGQTTVGGAFLDTIADKLLVTGTLFALVEVGRVWAWAAFVIVGREIAVMGLRGIVALNGVRVPPSPLGKWKAAVQFVAMGLAMLRLADTWGPLYLDQWWMLAAVVITVASGIEYFARSAGVIRSLASR